MHIRELHAWPANKGEAVKIQNRFRKDIVLDGSIDRVRLIAGVDTAFDHIADILYAAVNLFSFPDLKPVERAGASASATFPYTPGLHAFREGPVILQACSHLRTKPDLMLFAAHGIAHPRRFGLASHLGLILEIPAIGCARKKLVGDHADIDDRKGSMTPLMINGMQAGIVYRSREGVKPIFISPGHRCGTADAAEIVIACLQDYRMPEPLRAAHIFANRLKRAGAKRK